jgi:hypothetical protein
MKTAARSPFSGKSMAIVALLVCWFLGGLAQPFPTYT